MNIVQFNQIKGALYGVAVGDALGAPLEFMSAEEIRQRHGHVSEMIGGGWLNVRPGEITDDTQMTLCVARGILAAPEAPVKEIGKQFIEWLRTGPKDVGGTCSSSIRRAISHGGDAPSPVDWLTASKETDMATGGRSGGNGSLMRTVYVPCYYYEDDDIRRKAKDISTMTHYDPVAAEACMVYCRVIGNILNKRKYYTRWQYLMETVYHSRFAEALRPTFQPNPTGYVVDSMNAAIWSVNKSRYQHDAFRVAIETAVNLGGDADTIGAITGGIAGALYGYSRIPESWVELLDADLRAELDAMALEAELTREQAKREQAS